MLFSMGREAIYERTDKDRLCELDTQKIAGDSGSAAAFFILLLALSFLLNGGIPVLILRVLLAAAAAAMLLFFAYLLHARSVLSYEGGGVQGKILDNVLGYLDCSPSAGSWAAARRNLGKLPQTLFNPNELLINLIEEFIEMYRDFRI